MPPEELSATTDEGQPNMPPPVRTDWHRDDVSAFIALSSNVPSENSDSGKQSEGRGCTHAQFTGEKVHSRFSRSVDTLQHHISTESSGCSCDMRTLPHAVTWAASLRDQTRNARQSPFGMTSVAESGNVPRGTKAVLLFLPNPRDIRGRRPSWQSAIFQREENPR